VGKEKLINKNMKETFDKIKYPNTPREIDFGSLVLASKLSEMDFKESLRQLEQMQKSIVELEDYDYKNHLSKNEINYTETLSQSLKTFLVQVQGFELNSPQNFQIKATLEQQIADAYNNIFSVYVRPALTFLRQENSNVSQIERDAKSSTVRAEKLVKELTEKLDKLSKEEKSVENKAGIVSAKYLSQEFEEEYSRLEKQLARRRYVLGIPVLFVAGFLTIATIGTIYYRFALDANVSVKVEFGILSFLTFSLYFYLLRYVLIAKNILLHNAQVNRNKRNVAQTIINFLEAGGDDPEVKNELLKHGAGAMFASETTGYLNKDQMETPQMQPTKELINTIIKN